MMRQDLISDSLVVEFMGRVKGKIAEMGRDALRIGYAAETEELELLIGYIECLTDEHNIWPLLDIHSDIQFFNQRFGLNAIPYIEIVEADTFVLGGGTGAATSYDIADFAQRVQQVLRATPHNELLQIRGSVEGYHVSQQEYEIMQFIRQNFDKLKSLLYVAPTISLAAQNSVPAPVNGVYERGLVISQLTLSPNIKQNGAGSLLSTTYYVGGAGQAVKNEGTNAAAPYTYRMPLSASTIFKALAAFETGEAVQATTSVTFVNPYFTAIGTKGLAPEQLQLTKVVAPERGQIDVPYSFPVGNAAVGNAAPLVPYLLYAKARGALKQIYSNNNTNFPSLSAFSIREVQWKLVDGSLLDCYLVEKITPVDGNFTINFLF